MKIISLDKINIEKEHICCAISDKKCLSGYNMKKDLLKNEFDNGFVFKKYDVKHKVFIEYVPAENSLLPVEAPNYMLINCFWVAGSFKGKGLGKNLLNECIEDSKDKNGIAVISSDKKKPFLSDKKFFLKFGFEVCDFALPYFELLVLKNKKDVPDPKFTLSAKQNICNEKGLSVYYSNFCPYTDFYVNVELKNIADEYNLPLTIHKINTREEGRKNPSASIIYSLFYNGKFLTHEIVNKNKFEKLWKEIKN